MTLRLGDTLIAGSGANKDLSNLTSQGKNIANWSSNVTNCITEIPQDIKLELNSGTMTLKSGSKVYVPNGSGVFDVVTISSDTTITAPYAESQYFIFLYTENNALRVFGTSQCFSGTSAPSGQTYMMWYDTTNNSVKVTENGGSTWVGGYSFPLCIVSTDGTQITSIDQVFNGFGYIGSTWFLLPNVKFSATYGKNDDGSYKTYIINNPSVKTLTRTSGALSNWVICTSIVNYEVYDIHYEFDCYIVNGLPSSGTTYTSYFNMQDGLPYYTASGTTPNVAIAPRIKLIENCSCDSNGKVTNYGKFLLPFANALSINDSSTISGWSMPSSRYIDLTPLASGSTYTAPANGIFNICLMHPNNGDWIAWGIDVLDGNGNFLYNLQNTSWMSNQTEGYVIQIQKGYGLRVFYTNMSVTRFRFIYAEGEN